jgi:putative membrane protein
MDTTLIPACTAMACAFLAAGIACIPGLHIYNILGLIFWGYYQIMHVAPLSAEILTTGTLAMMSAFAVCNTIPAILLAAPDESALHTVLPGQKMLMKGHGREAIMLTAYGSLSALVAMAVCIPILPLVLPTVYLVMKDHSHWIIWSIIAFMLLSEWPKPIPPGQPSLQRFWLANKAATIGLIVFLLSGVLGFILFFRSPISAENAFQSLMPAFIGLFTLPGLLTNIWSHEKLPRQSQTHPAPEPAIVEVRQGSLAGILGGSFAAFFPVITGGVGGMLAGHATAIRGKYAFLVSQGASKTIYYTGGVILFFVPNLYLVRGGGAAMLKATVSPYPAHLYWMAGGAAILGGAMALVLLPRLIDLTLRLTHRFGYQRLSIASAIFVIMLVAFIAGWMGVCILVVATGIGMLPILYGTRRMNALGIILLPIACSMSGIAPSITNFLMLQ